MVYTGATDEDIGSILEEMSKIAGALSPNSAVDRTKSRTCVKNSTEEEKSVEELLEEAEKLVRKNSNSLSKSGSKSDTLVPENIAEDIDSIGRVRQLEADIFQLIEEEVHKETEKIRKSPKNDKKSDDSPGFDVLYENVNCLKAPKTLELQRRRFEEQKVEVSSSSDLDDPIERHSKSEELKSIRKIESDKDNLQKEITDVDKDFFEDLLRKSKERAEGGMSGSSSFGQEDFSHFLKLLQGQSDKKEEESNESNSTQDPLLKSSDVQVPSVLEKVSLNEESPEFPEKEISDILEKELPKTSNRKSEDEIETDGSASDQDRKQSVNVSSIKSKSESKVTNKKYQPSLNKVTVSKDSKKAGTSKEEFYTVGLTPRLELFADAIPKLLAEKSIECEGTHQNKQVSEDVKTTVRKTISNTEIKSSAIATTTQRKTVHPVSASSSSNKQQKKEIRFSKSKSYDQICKATPFRTSVENLKVAKSSDTVKSPAATITTSNLTNSKRSPILKSKLQPTIKPIVTRLPSKTRVLPKVKPKAKVKPKSKPKKDLKTGGGGSTSSLSSIYKGYQIKSPDNHVKRSMAAGDTKHNMTPNWENLCREERHKNILLKQQLEAEVKLYKNQIDNMRVSFEEELFALKKQNIILKARVDELLLNDKRVDTFQPKKDTKIVLLEKELEKQEKLIRAYETENKKLMQDTKRMQEEMKQLQKQKNTPLESGKMQELADKVKDLEEESLKVNLEISELREKNADYALKNEDLIQQNSLLNDELEMFKEQLRTKNDFITDRLQAMTNVELELKKQLEDLTIKLSSKTEQLRIVKQQFDRIQQNVLPLEKELLELRVKEGNLQEKLQVARSHVEREKQLTQKLKDQVILDSKKITDLNRQVREMERILKRKNPDSVSALILTANSEQEKIGAEKLKLLEDRISSLENEMKAKDDLAQQKVIEFQKKFSDMKEKYASQIMELEEKLLEANIKNSKIYNDMFTQTISKPVESRAVETIRKEERAGSFEKEDNNNKKDQKPANVKVNLKSQNLKDDAYLMATIRGLKLELANKDKALSKLTKELQEIQKTNRKLQKEREKLLNDRRSVKSMDFERINRAMVSSDSKLQTLKCSEGNDQNSNVYQNGNGHVSDSNSQRMSSSVQKLYDPMQYTENGESNLVKRLTDENDILKEELNKMNKDFMALKNKRLHDLNLLQEEHEREMASLLKEYSVKFGDSKVVKLQVRSITCTINYFIFYFLFIYSFCSGNHKTFARSTIFDETRYV